jgi:hypothetical protein
MIQQHSCEYAGRCPHVLAARADADAERRQRLLVEHGRDLMVAVALETPLPEEVERAESKRSKEMDIMHVHPEGEL